MITAFHLAFFTTDHFDDSTSEVDPYLVMFWNDLLTNAQNGDEVARKSLCDLVKNYAVAYLREYAPPRSDLSEDFVQEMVQIFLGNLKDIQMLSSWLSTKCSQCMNEYYRQFHFHMAVSLDGNPELADYSFEERALAVIEFKHLVRFLTEEQRKVISLRVLDQYPFRRIGKMLSISEEAAQSTFRRARNKLQKLMREIYGEGFDDAFGSD